MGCLCVHTERIGEGIRVSCRRVGEGLEVSCGLACSVNSHRISWAKDRLVWIGAEVGSVKYNMLTATKEWSLSEVAIEELL